MSGRARTEPRGGALTPLLEPLRADVRARLAGRPRLDHVESVVATILRIAAGWPAAERDAAERAAWYHDAVKAEGLDGWRALIRGVGEAPDPWAEEHVPTLLHAPAAAAWAAGRGERDPEVLDAVRHHPTGHAEWGAVGRALYVADFGEPTRRYAGEVGADAIVARAAEGLEGLAAAAFESMRLRLGLHLARRMAIHPETVRAWNRWSAESRA